MEFEEFVRRNGGDSVWSSIFTMISFIMCMYSISILVH